MCIYTCIVFYLCVSSICSLGRICSFLLATMQGHIAGNKTHQSAAKRVRNAERIKSKTMQERKAAARALAAQELAERKDLC